MIGLGGATRLRFNTGTNLVFDGNSLVAGIGASAPATTALPAQVAALPPVGGVIPAINLGVSGQTIRQMDGFDGGSAADVDGAFVVGKQNVLVCWEGTNSISNVGRSPSDALADVASYNKNRRLAHPGWKIVWLTTLPRQMGPSSWTQAQINSFNASLQTYDDGLRSNYRALGVDVLVDVRQPGSPFLFSDYSPASFAANWQLWSEPAGSRVHLADAGYAVVAGYVAAAFRRVPGHS